MSLQKAAEEAKTLGDSVRILTEWYEKDDSPVHPGLYEWEGRKERYFEWTGRYWLIVEGKTRYVYTEAPARWRGLNSPLDWEFSDKTIFPEETVSTDSLLEL